jgi:alpha-beta hydrolase superfamily lysophospholipase
MIAMRPVLSTARDGLMRPRLRLAALLLAIAVGGCAMRMPAADAPAEPVAAPAGVFTMRDGMQLPYREWLPASGEPWAVILALHGMNDSRDAWEIPGPVFAEAGIAVFAPDQRGFGDAPDRGRFAPPGRMEADAAAMLRDLRRRYPKARVILLGESMGAAVIMAMAAAPGAPRADGCVLVAPAVWSRSEMNVFMRVGLWFLAGAFPGLTNSGGIAHVVASDNRTALRRLSYDPLTIHGTRFDAVRGLVDLMDTAAASAGAMPGPALALYGGRDELIPPRATAAAWRAFPGGVRTAYYPAGYHLLLRDRDRGRVLADILAWIADPAVALPSGADRAGADWLAAQA